MLRMQRFRLAATRALAGLAAVLVLLLVIGYISGYRLLGVQSDSMAPTIRRGDAVLVRNAYQHIRPGDIISYTPPGSGGVINTHRVVSVDPRAGRLTTKGDNEPYEDVSVDLAAVKGVAASNLPLVGLVADFLRRPLGLVACLYVPAAIVVAAEVRRLNRYYRNGLPEYYVQYRLR